MSRIVSLTLTLSIDHRALDGAAAFFTDLQKLIEEPLGIVV